MQVEVASMVLQANLFAVAATGASTYTLFVADPEAALGMWLHDVLTHHW